MDLAAVATSLAYIDRDTLDPLALRAIEDTNPSFDPARIGEYSEQEWMGIANAAKGKYFEYLVVDRLNSGEIVGDLFLGAGQRAELADSLTQPGWDVRIVDEDGEAVELLQMKATNSVGYVRDALERYPDIRIVASSEVSGGLDANSMVLDAGISEREIADVLDTTLRDLAPGVMDHFWEAFNPLLPALVIAATQGYRVAVGKQDIREAFAIARDRAARGLAASAAGAIVKVVADSLTLGVGVSMLVGWCFDRSRNVDGATTLARNMSSRQKARHAFLLRLQESGA